MVIRLLVLLSMVFQISCSSVFRRMEERKQLEAQQEPTAPPVSDEQWLKNQIRSYEKALSTNREKEHYSKLLPWFKNDKEKLEYLSLSTLQTKQEWALDKKAWTRAKNPTPEMLATMQNGDIAIGMPMDYVKKAWGEPSLREVSGNPLFKNERWRYTRSISTQDGHRQEKRSVFFEGGQVVGWETE